MKEMDCGRDDCTGVHNYNRPRSELCESTKEKKRVAARRRRQTPGTYEYNESHGIGDAGEVMRRGSIRWCRAQANARDVAVIVALLQRSDPTIDPRKVEAILNG